LIGEHIIFSVAFAILVSAIVEYKWGYALPVWIIAACAWLPDIDYIVQSIMFPITHAIDPHIFFIVHGDFHNIVMVIILSLTFAWLLNKYLKIDYNDAFICVFLGCVFHVFCDYLVYMQPFCPIAPRLPCEITGLGLYTETSSWHGLGEPAIFISGAIFLMISIGIKFYLSESKWIGDQTIIREDN
jgi:membrane-bound metal-dependent hydrolase YbcI (DUF457 family)